MAKRASPRYRWGGMRRSRHAGGVFLGLALACGAAWAEPSRLGRTARVAIRTPAAESVGSPTDGRLHGGAELAPSRALQLKNPSGPRWGLPRLVALLERAAERVAQRFGGSVLVVGDLSRRQGGELGGHKSHESGRDADVAFFFVDAKGHRVAAAEFHPVDESGVATDDRSLYLDDARNWALIQAWVTDPAARVEHVFVADHLRERLLRYARNKGAYLPVLHRAAQVLKQPSRGLSHDDHFHVRIACPLGQQSCVPEPERPAPVTRFAALRATRSGRLAGAGRAPRPAPAPRLRPARSARPR